MYVYIYIYVIKMFATTEELFGSPGFAGTHLWGKELLQEASKRSFSHERGFQGVGISACMGLLTLQKTNMEPHKGRFVDYCPLSTASLEVPYLSSATFWRA